jgi:hypothetical protein
MHTHWQVAAAAAASCCCGCQQVPNCLVVDLHHGDGEGPGAGGLTLLTSYLEQLLQIQVVCVRGEGGNTRLTLQLVLCVRVWGFTTVLTGL